jgi:hypothetical protein
MSLNTDSLPCVLKILAAEGGRDFFMVMECPE